MLGAVTLQGEGDPPSSSRITQPRQLALLCYLALARPRGLHARDSLTTLLWPEEDDAHARRAMRNLLYSLRRVLGPQSIISAGDNLIGLDGLRISCDALDLEAGTFNARCGTSDNTAPELLGGLALSGCVDFDMWLSRERQRLSGLITRQLMAPASAYRPALAPRPGQLHSASATVMYARGHYLFLRAAHGGSPGDLLRSRDYFERAHALDRSFAPALAGLSNFYAVAARRGVLSPFHEVFAQALSLSERVVALDPALAVPHVHFGVKALYLDDDWDRAGESFATAVATEPEYAEAHRFYGVWLGLMQRHGEALNEMEIAAALEPDIPHMVSSLGAAYLAAGKRVEAEAALRRTLELDPLHHAARERLVRLLEDDGRLDDAFAERMRAPAMANDGVFRAAAAEHGPDGYHRALHDTPHAEAEALSTRITTRQFTVSDICAPPIVRLVSLYCRLGAWKQAKSWKLVGIAGRPALAKWINGIEIPAM